MFERESRLFELSSATMSVGEEAQGPFGGGGGGGGDAEQTDPGAETPAEGEQAAEGEQPAPKGEQSPVEEEQPVEEPPVDPVVAAHVERLLAERLAQQGPQFTPDVIKDVVAQAQAPLIEENRQFRALIQGSIQQQQQAAQMQQQLASRPKPPAETASVAEHLQWIKQDQEWVAGQANQRVMQEVGALKQMLQHQAQQQEQQARQAQAAQEAAHMDKAYAGAIQQLAAQPAYKAFANPGAAAVLRSTHEAYNRGLPPHQHASLPQVAAMMAEAFGFAPPTPAQNAAKRRIGEAANLQQQRDAVRTGKKPLPAAAAGKAAKVTNDNRATVLNAMKHGAKFDTSILQALNIDPNNPN